MVKPNPNMEVFYTNNKKGVNFRLIVHPFIYKTALELKIL